MAKNDVVITLRIDDAGNIKQVGNKAKKAAKDVDKLGKSAASTDRHMKGVSQQSSNASKNFSKMAQGMSGGLVPAYATLAAQVFAVTALFRFLQQAADFRVLIEGQKAFAAETGIAYNSIAKSLQNATDGQLAFREASQAAAIGSAGGMSPEQLERLAEGAKNVSIALGRDLTDSFNRLIRGTTKAEPELLDELGIILRLDEATKNYSAQIGKTANTLTIFEKSQAVTNEVLDQLDSKFGAIADNADLNVNALNQFAKAFDDVINKLYEFVGPIAEGLARFFGQNLTAFIGALGLFAIPIIKMILPAFDEMGDRALATAEKHRRALNSQKEDLRSYKDQFQQSRDKTGFARKSFTDQTEKMGISGTGRGKAKAIAHFETQTTQLAKGEIDKRTGMLANASKKDVRILKSTYTAMQGSASKFTLWVQRQNKTISSSYKILTTNMKAMWSSTMAFMSRAAATAGKMINKAFSILMFVSMLAMLFDLVKPYLDKYFGTNFTDDTGAEFNDAIENMKNLNTELRKMADRFNEKVGGPGTLNNAIQTAIFSGNMATSANIEGTYATYKSMEKSGFAQTEAGREFRKNLLINIGTLAAVEPELQKLYYAFEEGTGLTDDQEQSMFALIRRMQSGKAAAEQFATAQKELNRAQNDYIKSAAKLKFGNMVQQYRLGLEGAKELLTGAETTLANLSNPDGTMKRNLTDPQERRYRQLKGGDFLPDGTMNPGEIATLTAAVARQQAGFDQYTEFSQRGGGLEVSRTMMKTQAASITRTDSLADRAKKMNAIRQKGVDILQKELEIEITKDLMEKAKGPEEQAAAQIALTQQQEGLKLLQTQKTAMEAQIDPILQIKDASIAAFDQGLQKGIMGVLDGTKSMKEGFMDMAKAVLASIAQIIAQLIAMKALQAIGLPIPGFGFAMGGIKPKGYRSGGIVTEPTYLAGEGKYNEAIVPLPDGRSIPVVMKGGSGGTANVTVNISGNGQTTSSMEANGGDKAAQLGRAISVAVQEELHKQQRPGGMLSPFGV